MRRLAIASSQCYSDVNSATSEHTAGEIWVRVNDDIYHAVTDVMSLQVGEHVLDQELEEE